MVKFSTKFGARALASSAVSLTALLAAAPGWAQDEDTPQARGVDTLIVTAQKREESLQDVPIAVSAFSEEIVRGAGVDDIKDLIILSPSLNVTSTQNEAITTARIRGIGTVGDNPGLESSVGIVIDGVVRTRNGISFGDLGEIERIEVLRGPQGTLFGKNTSAGLINVVTKQPEFEWGASTELTVSNFEGFGVAGSVTGPVVEDKVAVRLYGAHRNRDGFFDVETGNGPRTEAEDGDRNFYTIRGQTLFVPTPDFEVRLTADYTERNENCCVAPFIQAAPDTAPLLNLLGGSNPQVGQEDPFSFVAQANRDTDQRVEDWGVSGEASWELGFGTLTSITAYREFDISSGQDTDFSNTDLVFRDSDLNGFTFETFTQELRLAGQAGNLDWQAGIFYASEDLERRDAIQLGGAFEPYVNLLLSQGASSTFLTDILNPIGLGAFAPFGVPAIDGFTPIPVGGALPLNGGSQGDVYNQDGESIALFTHNTYAATDRLDLTLGLRYTRENKEATADFSTPNAPGCAAFESLFGPALDFALPQNQLLLFNLSNALNTATGASLGPADVAQIASLTCVPVLNSDVFNSFEFDQERTENQVTGIAAASYRFTDDFNAYVSYSRGYKAGGFNLDRFNQAGSTPVDFTSVIAGTAEYPAQFEEETVDAYEIGFKTEWLSDQLLLNLTLFRQDFNDFQLNTFNGLSFFVTSLDEVVSQGVELETLWFPNFLPDLTFQGAVAYNDAEVQEFTPTGFADVDILSGSQLPLAPEWYVNGSLNYTPEISGLRALFNLSWRWVSSSNTGSDLDPEKEQDAFWLLNARVGLGQLNDRWRVEAWAENLTDTEYFQVAIDSPFQGFLPPAGPDSFNAFLGAPRTFGATLRTNF